MRAARDLHAAGGKALEPVLAGPDPLHGEHEGAESGAEEPPPR
jgi:hypothetical protein